VSGVIAAAGAGETRAGGASMRVIRCASGTKKADDFSHIWAPAAWPRDGVSSKSGGTSKKPYPINAGTGNVCDGNYARDESTSSGTSRWR
jgi:hypothetical protein